METSELRVFKCERCSRTYDETDSPSDYFCTQICSDIWTRTQAQKMGAPSEAQPVPNYYGGQ